MSQDIHPNAQQQIAEQFSQLPENCSNARYLDIQAKKLMGSGSFGKSLFHSNRPMVAEVHHA